MCLRAKGWLCLDLYVLSVRHNSVSSWHFKMVKMVNFMLCVFCFLRAQLLSLVKLFVTLWTIAHQAPLSMGLSRQEYWSGVPFPSPGMSPLRNQTSISCIGRKILYNWATWETQRQQVWGKKNQLRWILVICFVAPNLAKVWSCGHMLTS